MPYDYTDAPPRATSSSFRTVRSLPSPLRFVPATRVRAESSSARKDGACEMLDLEFTVVDGRYARSKVLGEPRPCRHNDGHARGGKLKPRQPASDPRFRMQPRSRRHEPQARAARSRDLKDFDGINFIVKIGVEKGKPKNDGSGENWPDKNIIAAIITPDSREWHPVEQPPPFNGGGNGAAVRLGIRLTSPGSTVRLPRPLPASRGRSGPTMSMKPPHPAALTRLQSRTRGSGEQPPPPSRPRARWSPIDGPIPPGTPIGRLGDVEWGWIVAAILFGWIATRAEQATAESSTPSSRSG